MSAQLTEQTAIACSPRGEPDDSPLACQQRPASVCLVFYALLGVILKLTHGHFHGLLLIFLTFGLLAFAWTSLAKPHGKADMRTMTCRLAAVGLLFALLLWHSPELAYTVDNPASHLILPVSAMMLALSAILWLATFNSIDLPPRVEVSVWVIAVASAFGLRFLTLLASPRPFIDVWVIGNLGSDVLLTGGNPYAADYPDIYQGSYDHAPHFFYWPGYLLTVAPFRWIFGDVRIATVAADVVVAGVFLWLSRRLGLTSRMGRLICLAWLMEPVSLFVLEQAWVDPIMMGGVAVLVVCLINGWWSAAGVALGYIVGVKQYGVLIAGLVLVALATRKFRGLDAVNLRSVLVAGLVTTGALFGPFLLIDARAFFESTIQPYLQVGLRPDALSIPAWIYNVAGWRVPDELLALIVLAAFAAHTFWLIRTGATLAHLTFAITLQLGTFFLFGKLAFCNYYYLVAFCALLHLVTQLSPQGAERLVVPCRANCPST